MTTTSPNLEIDELPVDKIHFEEHFTGVGDASKNSHHTKHSFTYLETMLYCITYRPVDGLASHEIDTIVNFVLGCDRLLYYAIGVEVLGGKIKTRHLHINVVMKHKCRFQIVRDLFEPLMKDARLAPRKDIALKVKTCARNEVRNKTVLLHGAYALKDAAIDKAAHQITAEHWNNRITTWTNIFDGKKDVERKIGGRWWKWKEERFAHLLYDKFHADHKSTVTLTRHNGNKLIRDYASKKNMEYTLDARPELVAEMVMDKSGTVNYEQTILKGRLQEQVSDVKGEDCYKATLTNKLRRYYASLKQDGGGRRGRRRDDTGAQQAISAFKCTIERLQKENEKLRKDCEENMARFVGANKKAYGFEQRFHNAMAAYTELADSNVNHARAIKRRKTSEHERQDDSNVNHARAIKRRKTSEHERQDDVMNQYKKIRERDGY